eukprot:NP_494519.3 Uncharacterized protein CELE_Y49F6C.6 [Caenorhabditis elegans]
MGLTAMGLTTMGLTTVGLATMGATTKISQQHFFKFSRSDPIVLLQYSYSTTTVPRPYPTNNSKPISLQKTKTQFFLNYSNPTVLLQYLYSTTTVPRPYPTTNPKLISLQQPKTPFLSPRIRLVLREHERCRGALSDVWVAGAARGAVRCAKLYNKTRHVIRKISANKRKLFPLFYCYTYIHTYKNQVSPEKNANQKGKRMFPRFMVGVALIFELNNYEKEKKYMVHRAKNLAAFHDLMNSYSGDSSIWECPGTRCYGESLIKKHSPRTHLLCICVQYLWGPAAPTVLQAFRLGLALQTMRFTGPALSRSYTSEELRSMSSEGVEVQRNEGPRNPQMVHDEVEDESPNVQALGRIKDRLRETIHLLDSSSAVSITTTPTDLNIWRDELEDHILHTFAPNHNRPIHNFLHWFSILIWIRVGLPIPVSSVTEELAQQVMDCTREEAAKVFPARHLIQAAYKSTVESPYYKILVSSGGLFQEGWVAN